MIGFLKNLTKQDENKNYYLVLDDNAPAPTTPEPEPAPVTQPAPVAAAPVAEPEPVAAPPEPEATELEATPAPTPEATPTPEDAPVVESVVEATPAPTPEATPTPAPAAPPASADAIAQLITAAVSKPVATAEGTSGDAGAGFATAYMGTTTTFSQRKPGGSLEMFRAMAKTMRR